MWFRKLAGIILLFSSLECAAAAAQHALRSLDQSNAIRTEAAATERAIAALAIAESATFRLYGKVLELSKAHVQAGRIKQGEWVWLVTLLNAGASDLNPVPEALVWVRAKDGVVVRLGSPE